MSTVMRRMANTALAFVLALAFVPVMAGQGTVPQAEAATGSDTLKISGTARYAFANQVMSLVNQERAANGLAPLKLDYELTETAMLRAAETALYFDHTRPDGSSYTTAFPSGVSASARGENIAAGQATPQKVMETWMNSAGHRANILSSNFTTIGIGCFTQGGTLYWVQNFSNASASGPILANDQSRTYNVNITYAGDRDTKHGLSMNVNFTYIKMRPGDTFGMSYGIVNGGWDRTYCTIDANSATWTSSNPAVMSVDANGKVTAHKVGSATITAKLPSGKSASQSLTVTEDITKATVDKIPDQVYTGSAIQPKPVVKMGGTTLKLGTDYTLSYYYNTNVGTRASVTIKGAGIYAGSQRTEYFTIKPASITSASLSQTSYVYDGTEKKPTVTVKAGGKTLSSETDYYVFNSGNYTSAGTKTLTIVGYGNYTGTRELTYTIKRAPITSVTLSQTTYAHDGSEKIPDVTVKAGNKVLSSGTDYRFFVSSPDQSFSSIGTKTVEVVAWGNYEGTLETTYRIVDPNSPDAPSNGNGSGGNSGGNGSSGSGSGGNGSGGSNGSGSGNGGSSGGTDESDPGISMFRLYNPNSGEHFYTASELERDSLVDVGWNYEGIGWTAPSSGEPVYRLYNPYAGEHHYTPNAGERDNLVAAGWNDEGEGWKSGGSVPLHRQYNPNEYANNHNYTSSDAEYQHLDSLGWRYEGVAWYALR